MDEPIIVKDGTLVGQLGALGRYILTAGGAYALGKGWVDQELLQLLTGLLTIAAPALYGVWKTWHNKSRLLTVAEAAPNNIAMVKA